VARTAQPFEREEEHCKRTAHGYEPATIIVGHQPNIEEDKERVHKGLRVPQPFLLEFGDDAPTGENMMNPDDDADDKERRLEPEGGIDGMRYDDHRDQAIREEMVGRPNNLGSLFLIGFPEHHRVDRPLRPFKGACLHCKTAVF
jgi:hypothetical protein